MVNDDFPIPLDAILGEDFLRRYKCSIDYERSWLIIRKEDETITIPFETKLRHGIYTIPPRCEVIREFPVEIQEDYAIDKI